MIDRDRIIAYVSEVRAALKILKEYSKLDKKTFLSSPVNIRDTKYCFIIAGQAAIDICYHLTANLLKKAPVDYSNCFELLSESGYFNRETLKKMMMMSKFRNLLVHHYIKVDDARVYEKLSETDTFEEFIQSLEAFAKQ
ncbi:MAG: DUF86 domain-containing protein [Nitrospinae bacterium]|nr:DUF86 domain-containing protein [Nitrospinota bacterium]